MSQELQKTINEVASEISKNHSKIIDDWCKAYLAQIYQEEGAIKPGDFTLNEQNDMVLDNGKIGKRYWFTKGIPNYGNEND